MSEWDGIYKLKRTYKDKEGETCITYNYFCFLYNSQCNYAACSSNMEALKKLVDGYLDQGPDSVINYDFIKTAVKHFVFDCVGVDKEASFIKRRVQNSVKEMICTKIVSLLKEINKSALRSRKIKDEGHKPEVSKNIKVGNNVEPLCTLLTL